MYKFNNWSVHVWVWVCVYLYTQNRIITMLLLTIDMAYVNIWPSLVFHKDPWQQLTPEHISSTCTHTITHKHAINQVCILRLQTAIYKRNFKVLSFDFRWNVLKNTKSINNFFFFVYGQLFTSPILRFFQHPSVVKLTIYEEKKIVNKFSNFKNIFSYK